MDLLHNFLQYLVPCNAVKIQVQKIDLLLNSLYPTCFTMLIPTFKNFHFFQLQPHLKRAAAAAVDVRFVERNVKKKERKFLL